MNVPVILECHINSEDERTRTWVAQIVHAEDRSAPTLCVGVHLWVKTVIACDAEEVLRSEVSAGACNLQHRKLEVITQREVVETEERTVLNELR